VETAAIEVLLAELRATRRTRIADVGANPLSPPPYWLLLDLRACEVVGFEPQTDAYQKLLQEKSDLETYLPYAVGNGKRQVLKLYRHSGFASVFEPYREGLAFLGKSPGIELERMEFETVRLDSLSELGEIDLLKIDVQGGELDVFVGAKATLAGAMAVITEMRFFPLYEREPMRACDEELRRQGFEMHKILFAKSRPLPNSQAERLHPRRVRDQLVDGDVVYLRNMSYPEAYSDEQLKHLCLSAAACFDSHSLVVHCLDLLVARDAIGPDLPRRYVDALSRALHADPREEK